ncbi:nucleotidyltransferase family protein [Candidatus Contubernalis alkaliaceticus]|uniref:nucleotidyltransferase family protein n=1 Tax=Candidatus Contubernalis alkaliaceticus TaxID=338645 RepID=UPI001F4C4576|nr:nucleotidyltransferase family protein [Candidatus Contubernalis alkalaceticus]UNC90694.1 NTP transferase domain-containing protein [Candidatus Contubernalis alkalaceticus]
MQALLLAGARGSSPLVEELGLTNKSLIPIHGKPMIQYVLEELNCVKGIKKITVVGPPEELKKIKTAVPFSIVPEKGEIMENMLEGFRSFSTADAGPTFILTSDIPLITCKSLEDFIERSLETQADFCYPVIEKEVCEKKYSGVVRTYVRLKEGLFTGGNIFLIDSAIVERTAKKAISFLALRKKPHLMAVKLGLPFIVKFIFKKVSLEDAERRASIIFGVKGKAIISPYAEIGFDVDKVSDLHLAEEYLK